MSISITKDTMPSTLYEIPLPTVTRITTITNGKTKLTLKFTPRKAKEESALEQYVREEEVRYQRQEKWWELVQEEMCRLDGKLAVLRWREGVVEYASPSTKVFL
jgi:hypothetical protein